MTGLGPLLFVPLYVDKIWAAPVLGGELGRELAAPVGTGEIWLLSDRYLTTRVAVGPLAGQGLDQLMASHGEWILGPGFAGQKNFPLLLKVLSVGQWLSVQVHPDDEAARRLEDEPWGKSEAWYVLDGEPGAQIVMGFKPEVTIEQLSGTLSGDELLENLAKVPARTGDAFSLPAGTVHATGPGLTIFEVQQASDITYRFYDWDRPGPDGFPRKLHQTKAMEVMKLGGPGRAEESEDLSGGASSLRLRVHSPYFGLVECDLRAPYRPFWGGRAARAIFMVKGQAKLSSPCDEFETLAVRAGQLWLIPAGLANVELTPVGKGVKVLEAVVLRPPNQSA